MALRGLEWESVESLGRALAESARSFGLPVPRLPAPGSRETVNKEVGRRAESHNLS